MTAHTAPMLVRTAPTVRCVASRRLHALRTSAVAAGRTSTSEDRAAAGGKDSGTDAATRPGGAPTVAELDARKFKEHWSVNWWKTYNVNEYVPDENAGPQEVLQKVLSTAQTAINSSGVLSNAEAQRYWAYHLARMGFFAAQGVSGLLAINAAQRARELQSGGGGGGGASKEGGGGLKLELLFRRGMQGPIGEALGMYYQDFSNIQAGIYNLPWDMTTSGHRQFNPAFVVSQGSRFLREAVDTLTRRYSESASTDTWLRSSMYPDYYLNTFHYQTDGWLSSWSANVYESSTETLFLGRQDAMQRQTLVPLAEFMAGRDASAVRMLEVAAGTGRFATFVKDNYPTARLTELELSPYYLEAGRRNMSYWKRMRAASLALGGHDGSGVTFLQAPAEAIPEPDGSYDVVYSVYLFHELPADVRRKVAMEMARVCKPGGMVILTDSVQRGDRPAQDASLGNFGDFNEPYYRNYIETDIGELFQSAGLVPDTKVTGSSTKALSFLKPEQPATVASQGAAAVGEAESAVAEAESSADSVGDAAAPEGGLPAAPKE